MATETPSRKSLSLLRDPVGQSSGLVGLPNASLGAGLAAKYSGPNLGLSPPNHAEALSPGVGSGLGSLGAEQAGRGSRCGRAGGGPGAWNIHRASLSSSPVFPVSFHPEPPRWAEKLWKGSFSPKEKTGPGEALGAHGTPDSGALEVGLLPRGLAQEARPGLDTNPHPPHLPGSSRVFQCQLDKSLLMADLQAQRSDLGSGH